MKIIPYSNQHKDQIIKLILDIQVEEFNVAISITDQPDLLNIESFYQQGTGNFWVATVDEQVIGTIGLFDIGNSQSVLRKMFVASNFRGKEKGVATNLLNTLLDWSREKNIKEIYLGTVATYFAAHKFYEKNGFKEINQEELPTNFKRMGVDSKFYLFYT
jgi:N-acetylglutamate synthase-like GNAT family acetyltransferase